MCWYGQPRPGEMHHACTFSVTDGAWGAVMVQFTGYRLKCTIRHRTEPKHHFLGADFVHLRFEVRNMVLINIGTLLKINTYTHCVSSI